MLIRQFAIFFAAMLLLLMLLPAFEFSFRHYGCRTMRHLR
jgi:hypothetical protein